MKCGAVERLVDISNNIVSSDIGGLDVSQLGSRTSREACPVHISLAGTCVK